MSRILLALLLVLTVVAPVSVSSGFFNDYAILDVSQTIFTPEPAICLSPDPDYPDDATCAPRSGRDDWDTATADCIAAGFTKWECYASVTDGEF